MFSVACDVVVNSIDEGSLQLQYTLFDVDDGVSLLKFSFLKFIHSRNIRLYKIGYPGGEFP